MVRAVSFIPIQSSNRSFRCILPCLPSLSEHFRLCFPHLYKTITPIVSSYKVTSASTTNLQPHYDSSFTSLSLSLSILNLSILAHNSTHTCMSLHRSPHHFHSYSCCCHRGSNFTFKHLPSLDVSVYTAIYICIWLEDIPALVAMEWSHKDFPCLLCSRIVALTNRLLG